MAPKGAVKPKPSETDKQKKRGRPPKTKANERIETGLGDPAETQVVSKHRKGIFFLKMSTL